MNRINQVLVATTLVLFSGTVAWAGETTPLDAIVANAFELKNQKKFDEAIRKFELALEQSPKYESAQIGLGRTHGAKRDYKNAEKIFLRTIKDHPKSVPAHRYLSLTYLWMNKLGKAEKIAKKATRLAPKQWESFHSLAEIQMARRRWSAAIKSEKKALKLDSKNLHACTGLIRSYQALGKLKKASKYARKASDIAPKLLEPHIKLAELYALQGKRLKGIKVLKNAEKLAGDQIQRIAILATSFVLLGAPGDASRLYRTYLKAHPDSAIGHAALAETYVKQRKFDLAKKHAGKSRKLDPKSPMAYQILGVIAALNKDLTQTDKYYRLAIERARKPLQLRLRLELAMLLADGKKSAKAIGEFETILKEFPKASQVNRPLCHLYLQMKRKSARSKRVCLAACKEVSIKAADCSLP